MNVYEMEGRLRKRVYNQIKLKTSFWKKLGWLNILLWVIMLVCAAAMYIGLYNDLGKVTIEEIMIIIVACIIFPGIFNCIFYGFLLRPIAEITVPESHRIILNNSELRSDWVALPNQCGNVGGTEVSLVMPYHVITGIVWNQDLQRLEIHGDYSQKLKTIQGKWEEKDNSYFTLNKKEKVLHIYGYFPQMQELINNLQAMSGHAIETLER